MGPTHLSFREAEAVRQLLPLGAYHVVVLLEGVFQPQKLGRGKGGSDPLRLSGQRVVQKEALGARVVPCGGHNIRPVREGLGEGGGGLAGAARFSGAGLAEHRAQGPRGTLAAGPVASGSPPARPLRPARRALPGRHPPRSCPCWASPPAPDLRGLISRLDARASPPPSRAPGSEEGAPGTGPGMGAHDPQKRRLSPPSNLSLGEL